jgi:glycerophosphoryl diester phosphodiesterase
VIHDPVLDRVSDRSGLVGDLPWSEVAAARVDGTEGVPRLDEMLAAWPDVRWNIDAKHEAVVGPLADVVRRAGAVERVAVTSFSDDRIGRLRRARGPTLCTGTGPRGIAALRLAATTGVARPLAAAWRDAGATQVPRRWGLVPVIDRRFVDFAHRQGLAVHAWTIDDEAAMDQLLDLGVDGIMTDRPSRLRTVLLRRGQWSGPSGPGPGDGSGG